MTPKTLSLLKLPKTNLESRETALEMCSITAFKSHVGCMGKPKAGILAQDWSSKHGSMWSRSL